MDTTSLTTAIFGGITAALLGGAALIPAWRKLTTAWRPHGKRKSLRLFIVASNPDDDEDVDAFKARIAAVGFAAISTRLPGACVNAGAIVMWNPVPDTSFEVITAAVNTSPDAAMLVMTHARIEGLRAFGEQVSISNTSRRLYQDLVAIAELS